MYYTLAFQKGEIMNDQEFLKELMNIEKVKIES